MQHKMRDCYWVPVLLGLLGLLGGGHGEENNVCPTFKDYYTIKNNSRCWYDFAADYTAPDIIRLSGYPVIEYKVPTADGYILTLFRIPSDNVKNPNAKSHPVYLQHGLVATCSNFLGLGKDSLAFLLADAGYDVWLGNYRGNQYSEEHVNLTVFDSEYWEHSLDEIVIYDFPAIFSTVLHYTDPHGKIIYVGHSLGTTLALMYAAEFPEVARNTMQFMALMSPAYTLANMISPYKLAAPYGAAIVCYPVGIISSDEVLNTLFSDHFMEYRVPCAEMFVKEQGTLCSNFRNTVRDLEMYRIVSQAGPLRQAVRTFCLESPPLMRFCLQLYNLFYGRNTQLGPEKVPVYFNQLPGGTALKILNHAADLVMGNFRKYNYIDKNYQYYGSHTPPIYDIKKIEVPVHLIYSTQDWATTEADAWNLWDHLPEKAKYGIRRIDLPDFNHIDFIFGRHARTEVYEELIQVLNKVIE